MSSPAQIRNVRRHRAHFEHMAKSHAHLEQVLADPSPDFVRALSTVMRVAHKRGWRPKGPHKTKLQAMMSPSKAIATKKSMIQTTSRSQSGKGFWGSLAVTALPLIAAAL